MSTIDSEHAIDDEDQASPITHGTHFADMKRRMSGTKTPPSLPQISETPGGSGGPTEAENGEQGAQQSGEALKDHDASRPPPRLKTRMSMEDAKLLGRSLSDAVLTPVGDKTTHEPYTREAESGNERPLVNPAELAARLYSNPKLTALKSPGPAGIPKNAVPISPPILANPKCSGYFVEPVSANEYLGWTISCSA
jgi:dual specificity phosphatase 12